MIIVDLVNLFFRTAGELRAGAATLELAVSIDPPVGRIIASGRAANAASVAVSWKRPWHIVVTETPPARLTKSVKYSVAANGVEGFTGNLIKDTDRFDSLILGFNCSRV